jgi:conserved oligomeric Golgi complex subunit 1
MDIRLGWIIRSRRINQAAGGGQPARQYMDMHLPPTLSQVSSNSSKERPDNEASVIEQHLLRTQILLAPLLPPVPLKRLTHPNKSSTKDTRTESLLLFGIPAVEQTAQPVMDLVKPGPRFGSLLVGSTTVAR